MATTRTATPKQIGFALGLIRRAGYSTGWLVADHRVIGAPRGMTGTVEDWLSTMTVSEISNLIDDLKEH